jgi:hypothetical protein
MRTVLIAGLFAVMITAVFVMVLLNRASEKILSAVPIAIAGLVAVSFIDICFRRSAKL